MFLKFIICLIAGIGAGLGTGFAGMSAAAVISPMLITFLDMDPYIAVGIALASDVLASAVSAYNYGKNKNIDVKNGIVMMIFVLLFTLVGSFVSSKVPSTAMGNFSFVMTLFLGIKFIVKPVTEPKARLTKASDKQKIIRSALSGCMVGFICGFVGAGGGMMMLLVLTSVLGYELKTGYKCVCNGVYCVYGFCKSLCNRWFAGCLDSCILYDFNFDICSNCFALC